MNVSLLKHCIFNFFFFFWSSYHRLIINAVVTVSWGPFFLCGSICGLCSLGHCVCSLQLWASAHSRVFASAPLVPSYSLGRTQPPLISFSLIFWDSVILMLRMAKRKGNKKYNKLDSRVILF